MTLASKRRVSPAACSGSRNGSSAPHQSESLRSERGRRKSSGKRLADARRTIERLVSERDRARDVLAQAASTARRGPGRGRSADRGGRGDARRACAKLEERARAASHDRTRESGRQTHRSGADDHGSARPFRRPPAAGRRGDCRLARAYAADARDRPRSRCRCPARAKPTPPPEELRGALFISEPPERGLGRRAPAPPAGAAPSEPPPATAKRTGPHRCRARGRRRRRSRSSAPAQAEAGSRVAFAGRLLDGGRSGRVRSHRYRADPRFEAAG